MCSLISFCYIGCFELVLMLLPNRPDAGNAPQYIVPPYAAINDSVVFQWLLSSVFCACGL